MLPAGILMLIVAIFRVRYYLIELLSEGDQTRIRFYDWTKIKECLIPTKELSTKIVGDGMRGILLIMLFRKKIFLKQYPNWKWTKDELERIVDMKNL